MRARMIEDGIHYGITYNFSRMSLKKKIFPIKQQSIGNCSCYYFTVLNVRFFKFPCETGQSVCPQIAACETPRRRPNTVIRNRPFSVNIYTPPLTEILSRKHASVPEWRSLLSGNICFPIGGMINLSFTTSPRRLTGAGGRSVSKSRFYGRLRMKHCGIGSRVSWRPDTAIRKRLFMNIIFEL